MLGIAISANPSLSSYGLGNPTSSSIGRTSSSTTTKGRLGSSILDPDNTGGSLTRVEVTLNPTKSEQEEPTHLGVPQSPRHSKGHPHSP